MRKASMIPAFTHATAFQQPIRAALGGAQLSALERVEQLGHRGIDRVAIERRAGCIRLGGALDAGAQRGERAQCAKCVLPRHVVVTR